MASPAEGGARNMDLLPKDAEGRYVGLSTRDQEVGGSPKSGDLEANELEDLLAMGNSGDPEALEKLRQYFGERNAPGVFRRLLFRAMAKGGLGAYGMWDHWNAQAEFERVEEKLRQPDASFAESLIAEAAAFAYVHNHLAHRRLYDILFECRLSMPEQALRDQGANAARASRSFVNLMREVDNARVRRTLVERCERARADAVPEVPFVEALRERVALHDPKPEPGRAEERVQVQS
jgi:hypothetical protein